MPVIDDSAGLIYEKCEVPPSQPDVNSKQFERKMTSTVIFSINSHILRDKPKTYTQYFCKI